MNSIVQDIRIEQPHDYEQISTLLMAAFSDHPYSQQTEHLIVRELRKAKVMSLAYVALSSVDRVIGHIAFSPVEIGGNAHGWYGLGPIGVLPEFQRGGVGSSLIKQGLRVLKSRGAKGCVLVGDPQYYKRFGFSAYPDLTVEGVPQEFVLGCAFDGSSISGEIVFHKAFSVGQ